MFSLFIFLCVPSVVSEKGCVCVHSICAKIELNRKKDMLEQKKSYLFKLIKNFAIKFKEKGCSPN